MQFDTGLLKLNFEEILKSMKKLFITGSLLCLNSILAQSEVNSLSGFTVIHGSAPTDPKSSDFDTNNSTGDYSNSTRSNSKNFNSYN